MNYNIDIDFYNLIDFIKERNLEQTETAIKENYIYLKNTQPNLYNTIVNYYNKNKMWGTLDLNNKDYELIKRNADALVNHSDDFVWLYNSLGDYRSKKILVAILYYWFSMDNKRLIQLTDNYYYQYFDQDLIECDKNEVFVDIGSYIGDTVVNYVKSYSNYKKIYCYEIIPANIEYIKKNVELFNLEDVVIRKKGISDKIESLYIKEDSVSSTTTLVEKGNIKINTTTIDKDIKEKITFIKMDIEGDEVKALKGCLDTIAKHRPKFALAAYHNNNHLWQLAKMIHDVDPSYKFYLRYYGGDTLPLEYVLYAK